MNGVQRSIQPSSAKGTLSATLPVVPAFTYLRAWEQLRGDLEAAMRRVLDSGCLILGPEGTAFENEFADYVGAKFAVGTSSGTDALILALRALGVAPNAEVLTVANGPVPTISAIRTIGARPRFVDIDPRTLQMCPQCLRDTISSQTACVIPIHLYGQAAPLPEILEVANAFGVPVIEDCAQAHGTLSHGKHVGGAAIVGCFSFYPTKNIGGFGDAGICVTNDLQLAMRIREIGCYGFRDGERVAHSDGQNSRLDELQAAILRVRLRHFPKALDRRIAIAHAYQLALSNHSALQLTGVTPGSRSSWHQFVVRTAQRDALLNHLHVRGIQTAIHYPHAVHRMPAYQRFGDPEGSLPHTERACREVVSLPMFPELHDEEIQRVALACAAFRGHGYNSED